MLFTLLSAICLSGCDKKEIRVLNSVCLFLLNYVALQEINSVVWVTGYAGVVEVAAFGVNLVWMFLLRRKEMFYIQLAYSLLYTVGAQCVLFIREDVLTNYYPYALFMGFATGVYAVRNLMDQEMGKAKGYGKLSLLLAVNGGIQYLVWKTQSYGRMGLMMVVAASVLMLGAFEENKKDKVGIRSVALIFAELGVLLECLNFTHSVTTTSIFWGLGIVLWGYICYDRSETIAMIQFMLSCILMSVLLLNAVVTENSYDVFALAISGVIVLVAASIANSKRYAMLATIVLVIMVFYLTRAFWLSIAWWVYLFVAGCAMVIMAIRKEVSER